MKLHRALSTAVAVAAIGSVSLLTSPAAYASDATPSPTYTRPAFCSGIPDEDRGKTGLRGLPSEIVAGSGWHEYTYRVTNVSTVKLMETDLSFYLGTADPKIDDVSELAVTVEWFNPKSGAWQAVEGGNSEWNDNEDFATVGSIAPGAYADSKLRMKIGKEAKAGTGYFFTTGHSYGEDGQCGFDKISQFDFTVLPAGSEPGKVDDAKGRPGAKKDQDALAKERAKNGDTPQGGRSEVRTEARVADGDLAETGSSSALPVMAAAGGAAVVAGAAAVFVVRRRKASAGE
ncbi:LAETG motif-containing sortase-dependent surface protein [Streptomyces sp. NPDC059002]|uniref:LAETG motif-containing sortase-dependent surface protein n=1 Tax=Streptomyces sp. NPDC059002 TaxID=3346690 RepID=UPI003677EDF8